MYIYEVGGWPNLIIIPYTIFFYIKLCTQNPQGSVCMSPSVSSTTILLS